MFANQADSLSSIGAVKPPRMTVNLCGPSGTRNDLK